MTPPTQTLPTVGMVLDHPFPPDSRVAREATTLVAAGHTVHLLCAQDKDTPRPTTDKYNGVYLHRVDAVNQAKTNGSCFGVRRNRLFASGLLKNWHYQQHGIDTPWQWAIEDFIEQHNIDIIHGHDLRVLPATIAAAQQSPRSVKVVSDLHEFYPALIRQLKSKKSNTKGNKAYSRWVNFEQRWLPKADFVWVLDDASRDRLLTYPNIEPSNVGLLPNVVSVKEFDAIAPDTAIMQRYEAHITLVYAGHVNHTGRGLQFVIEALPTLLKDYPALKLVLAGATRPDYQAQLEQLAAKLNVNHAIDWTGPLDDVGMAHYIQAATICLCPTVESEQTNSGIPNKIFQYALFAKPQVVSSAKPQTRWVQNNNCGLSFSSGNTAELNTVLNTLLANPEQAKQMGANGRQAVLSHSSWEAITPAFLSRYQ
jgi:glycosyltransferase involved in cell wall biosynthesis